MKIISQREKSSSKDSRPWAFWEKRIMLSTFESPGSGGYGNSAANSSSDIVCPSGFSTSYTPSLKT